MKRLTLQALSLAMILSFGGLASAGTVETGVGKITAMVLHGGDSVLRLGVDIPGVPLNPAGCNTAVAGFALQLNDPGRSAEETRALVNTAQLAFMTGRPVRLKIRDDLCLPLDDAPHRVLTGITVTN